MVTNSPATVRTVDKSRRWVVTVETSTAPGLASPDAVKVQFLDKQTGTLIPSSDIEFLPTGTKYSGTAELPDVFEPAALTVQVFGKAPESAQKIERTEAVLYFHSITLTADTADADINSCHFPMMSWVASSQKARVFLEGSTSEPFAAHIHELIISELKLLRGETLAAPAAPRQHAERIYQYDTYCDLGTAEGEKKRPTLGGSAQFPYPRRLRTGREKVGDIEPNFSNPWLPLDEQFSYSKGTNFLGISLQGAIPALLEVLEQAFRPQTLFDRVPLLKPELRLLKIGATKQLEFHSFSDVSKMFMNPEITLPVEVGDRTSDTIIQLINDMIGRLGHLAKAHGVEVRETIAPQVSDLLKQPEQLTAVLKETLGQDIRRLRSHTVPKVLAGRPDAWHQDFEFGRQLLAGENPLVLQALDAWPKPGWSTTDKDLEGLLGGKSVQELLDEGKASGKPKLFIVDYTQPFASFIDKVNVLKGRHLYAGRALLMLSSEAPAGVEWANPEGPASLAPGQVAQWLVPLAIELMDGQGTRVYTSGGKATPTQIWLLAKTAFDTLHAGVHQLVSHWQRTHAAVEPYAIAMRRQLSTVHPVHKLMIPHFRFTLSINASARGVLINAGGIVEKVFTPGPHCLELASTWYGQCWTFESQALPVDLYKRGLMKPATQDNSPLGLMTGGELLLDDYPYAEDGMLIWGALRDYFKAYLGIYYKSDADVVADEELQAWWKEIKEEGHPDIKTGWPSLNGVDDLLFILTTMAWTASAHHAAVNFGQYDYAGFMLNRSTIFRKPIPAPGSTEFEELTAATGKKLEKLLLEYMMDPLLNAIVMALTSALSSHAEDEMYLTSEAQEYLVDPEAKAAHAAFVRAMKEVEDRVQALNKSGTKPSRTPAAGGLPYTLLVPSSGPGITSRGIPYSVSI